MDPYDPPVSALGRAWSLLLLLGDFISSCMAVRSYKTVHKAQKCFSGVEAPFTAPSTQGCV